MIVCASNSLSSLTNLNAHPATQSGTRTFVRRPSQITKEKVGVPTNGVTGLTLSRKDFLHHLTFKSYM